MLIAAASLISIILLLPLLIYVIPTFWSNDEKIIFSVVALLLFIASIIGLVIIRMAQKIIYLEDGQYLPSRDPDTSDFIE